MTRFLSAAFAVGVLAVVLAMVILQVLASDPNGGAATLREDDLVCLMEAAFAAGVAGFSFWAAGTRTRFARSSLVLTATSSFAAAALLGFFIERRFDETLQRPSLRAILPALLAAGVIVLWQRRFALARQGQVSLTGDARG